VVVDVAKMVMEVPHAAEKFTTSSVALAVMTPQFHVLGDILEVDDGWSPRDAVEMLQLLGFWGWRE
jgi:hypothetical protein